MLAKEEVQKARVYIAAPFFSPEQIARVKRVEEALEANPFVEDYFSPRLNQVEQLAFGSEAWRTAVFNQDITYVDWSTVIVAVADMSAGDKEVDDYDCWPQHTEIDADADSGTAFELGYAYATKKPVIVLHETDTTLNLMLSDSLHFYTKNVGSIEDYNFIKMPKSKYTGEVI